MHRRTTNSESALRVSIVVGMDFVFIFNDILIMFSCLGITRLMILQVTNNIRIHLNNTRINLNNIRINLNNARINLNNLTRNHKLICNKVTRIHQLIRP